MNGTATCNGTSCGATCNSGFHACGQTCVADSSVTQCGASCTTCTPPANASPVCTGGACDFTCNTGFHRCGNTCVSNTSVDSCGSSCTPCATVTNAARTCSNGTCGFSCNSGFHACGSSCAADTSTTQCGASCVSCTAPANASSVCSSGACDFVCNSGFHRCGNACVSDSSATQCGLACLSCTAPANASPACITGACDFTCNTGFHRCGNACVSNTSVDSCGSSCSPCPNGPADSARACISGSCSYTCNSGFNNCGGQCLADSSDSCGASCAPCSLASFAQRATCSAGVCGSACINTCSSMCVDVNSDVSNCGACGVTCGAGEACTQRQCRRTCAFPSFFPVVPTVPTFASNSVLAAGDLTNDGLDDLVVGAPGAVDVRITRTDGTLALTQTLTLLSPNVNSLVIRDLDGDGWRDLIALAATSNGSAQISVMKNSAGVLGTPTNLFTGTVDQPTGFAIADVTGDGRLDIVVGMSGVAGTPGRVFAQTAMGAFPSSASMPQPIEWANRIETADFDSNGLADFVYANAVTWAITIQTSPGVFSVTTTPFTTATTRSTALVDLDVDGKIDVLFRTTDDTVEWRRNLGSGSFSAPASFSFPGVRGAVAARDLNGDGWPDLVSVGDSLFVAKATSPGVWGATVSWPLSAPTSSLNHFLVAFGQFGGDARPDVATASNATSVLINDGTGAFPAFITSTITPITVAQVQAGDVTGDGRPDLLLADAPGPGINGRARLFPGLANGTFAAQSGAVFMSGSALAVARVDGDAFADVAVGREVFGSTDAGFIDVFPGTAAGTLSGATAVPLPGQPRGAWLLDVAGSSAIDLVASTNASLQLFVGNGNGTFQPGQAVPSAGFVDQVFVSDFNFDGRKDLASVNGQVNVHLAQPSGTFSSKAVTSSFTGRVAFGDVTGDGRDDFIVTTSTGSRVWSNEGNATFSPGTTIAAMKGRLELVDVDRDGKLDVVAFNSNVEVWRRTGNFTFEAPRVYSPGKTVIAAAGATADFTQDGLVDAVIVNDRTMFVLPAVCR